MKCFASLNIEKANRKPDMTNIQCLLLEDLKKKSEPDYFIWKTSFLINTLYNNIKTIVLNLFKENKLLFLKPCIESLNIEKSKRKPDMTNI